MTYSTAANIITLNYMLKTEILSVVGKSIGRQVTNSNVSALNLLGEIQHLQDSPIIWRNLHQVTAESGEHVWQQYVIAK